MAGPGSVAQGLADYIQFLGGASRRTSYIAQEAASNTRLQALLAEAATSDTPGLVFARISKEFDPPAMDRAAMAYGERGRPSRPNPEAQLREGVAEELGPFYREAPMEAVNEARRMLGPTMGGEDLVNRLQDMTPRPLYAMDLPGDTSVRSQMEATAGPFEYPVPPPPRPDFTGAVDVAGPPAAYRQSVRVRPSRAALGSGAMDTTDAARAMEVLAPSDLGTSLADTGALGPAAMQMFGVSGPASLRQVGRQGGGRVLGDVIGPRADLSVQVAGPGGLRSDVLPGSGVAGEMPVGQAGDVIGPGVITEDMITPGGLATVDDAVGPAGAWENRVGRRSGQVTGEDTVFAREEPDFVELPPEELAPAAPTPSPPIASTPIASAVPGVGPGRQAPPPSAPPAWSGDAARSVSRVAAGTGALAGAAYMMMPQEEFEEPPVVASPDDLVSDAVITAIDGLDAEPAIPDIGDLQIENDLDAPVVEFSPPQVDDELVAGLPADDLLEDVPEALAPLEPMVGQPVGVGSVPVYRRLQEIRDLLQRGGSEDRVRNNPRYADIDDHMREMAILRGRDLGSRRDRVRMAGILSQGGRLPYGQAAAAGDRYLRMDPQEQQDFLATGGFSPSARGAMQSVADRIQHRNKLAEIKALGENQMAIADKQGEWGVRGAEVGAKGQLDVAGLNANVALGGQAANERLANADRALKRQELAQDLAIANARFKQATDEGNATRAAAARSEVARLQMEGEKLAASDRQSRAANESRERVARMSSPEALDPLEAVDRTATANAIPVLLNLVGRSTTRKQAFSAIRRDPVASQASVEVIKRALDRKFPQ